MSAASELRGAAAAARGQCLYSGKALDEAHAGVEGGPEPGGGAGAARSVASLLVLPAGDGKYSRAASAAAAAGTASSLAHRANCC